MKKLIHEIHRRSLWQVLGIYAVGAWIGYEVIQGLTEGMGLPAWFPAFAVVLFIIGLPIVLATAFVQEGMGRRDPGEVETTSGGTPIPSTAVDEGTTPRLFTWRNAILGGVVAFALLFGFAGVYVVIQDRGQAFSPETAVAEEADPGIAFMPFDVSGSGVEHLREGMVHLLFASLDGAAGLRAISDRTVLAQWDRLVGTGQRADLETAMGVAAATGARYMLLGSVVVVGPRLRLSGDIYELPDGTSLGRVQTEGNPDSLTALVEDLAVETLRALAQAGVEIVPKADLTGATTHSLPALTAYLNGEAYFRRGDFETSVPYFEAALEFDSTFALAHYRIGSAGGWGLRLESREAHLAGSIEGNLTPRRLLIARAARLDPGLQEDLEELVRRYPDDAEAWWVFGDWLMHEASRDTEDPVERAEAAFGRAAELDPGFAPYVFHLIDYAYADHDEAEAKRWVEHYGRASPGSASDRTNRITYSLLFEPAKDSLTFDAAIDTLAKIAMRSRLQDQLGSPRSSGIGIAVALRKAEQTGELDGSICHMYALAEGRWRDFLQYAADPRLKPGWQLTCAVHALYRDYPVPQHLVVGALPELGAQEAEWELSGVNPMIWAGTFAALNGDWQEYERLLAGLRAQPEMANLVPILEGYGQWQAGNLEEALKTLESAPKWPPVRWWLGQINLELGRPDIAARYFSTFFTDGTPWTRSLYYLGLAYEEMGELEKAQEAYAEYLDIWKDADPELEPMKEQSRVRLEAILAERG